MSATAESVQISRDPQFQALLEHWQARVERELAARLPLATARPTRLHEALRYSVLGAGKRVRPVLVYATANALGIAETNGDGVACAVEFIHAYSLVHDDLPARTTTTCGGPSHVPQGFRRSDGDYVGDALQVLAFETLASGPGLPSDAAVRLDLVRCSPSRAARAAWPAVRRWSGSRRPTAVARRVEEMHERKTGALIHASVMMAAACAERRSDALMQALDEFARAIGLAFQIQDDLLDIEGDPTLLGKATGADRAHDKATYPLSVGVETARRRMHELHAGALAALAVLGSRAAALASVSDWLVLRKH